jgi:hypothetical protein
VLPIAVEIILIILLVVIVTVVLATPFPNGHRPRGVHGALE